MKNISISKKLLILIVISILALITTSLTANLDKYEIEHFFNTEDKQLLEYDRKALNAYLTEVEDVFKKVEAKDISGISEQFSPSVPI